MYKKKNIKRKMFEVKCNTLTEMKFKGGTLYVLNQFLQSNRVKFYYYIYNCIFQSNTSILPDQYICANFSCLFPTTHILHLEKNYFLLSRFVWPFEISLGRRSILTENVASFAILVLYLFLKKVTMKFSIHLF